MLKNIAFVLRFQGPVFILGLLLLGYGVYSILTYKPVPSSMAFEAPPYQYLFWASIIIGVILTVRAWTEGINSESI